MRLLSLLAAVAAASCLVSGCGKEKDQESGPGTGGQKPAASTAPTLPVASGPLLTVDGDYPYTVQGVALGTLPVANGEPAKSGHMFAAVIVEVKAKMQDRPLPAPTPRLGFRWDRCDGFQCQSEPVQRPRTYTPRAQADQAGQAQEADPGQMLQPGDSHLTFLTAQVPTDAVSRDLELCSLGAFSLINKCIPVNALPGLPESGQPG